VFIATLSVVGVRAAPGVMINPLQRAFGWDVSTISGAIAVNIILLGATGPFLAGMIQTFGLKRTQLGTMTVLLAGTGLSTFMSEPWQLFLTWGVMVGVGIGSGAIGMAGAIANRWFAQRTATAMGLITSANAAGQLIFLPLLASLSETYGWQGVSIALTCTIAVMMVLLFLMMPESPAELGMPAYGATVIAAPPRTTGNPFAVAIAIFRRAMGSVDFWLLSISFGVCGFSTAGLINTHFIAYCADMAIPETSGAWLLAGIGVFSLIGATGSGWLCDRYNPRVLLFWYYALRGLSLVILPLSDFDVVTLSIFTVFYGLDWVATGPATFALTNEVFGRRDAPVVVAWVYVFHQVGGAIAAYGAGLTRSLTGAYLIAFLASGIACFMAAMLVLRVTRVVAPVPAVAAE
jgi:predicted MFS family arabinose efflux permease